MNKNQSISYTENEMSFKITKWIWNKKKWGSCTVHFKLLISIHLHMNKLQPFYIKMYTKPFQYFEVVEDILWNENPKKKHGKIL